MIMHKPPHPGEVLRELYFEPLELSVTQGANALDVSKDTLSDILNCRSSLSPEMAIRLSLAFDTTPESWLNLQQQYDLWYTRKNHNFQKVIHLQKNEIMGGRSARLPGTSVGGFVPGCLEMTI